MKFNNFFKHKLIGKLNSTIIFVQIFLLIYLVAILLLSGYIIELIKELRIFSYYDAKFHDEAGETWHFIS